LKTLVVATYRIQSLPLFLVKKLNLLKSWKRKNCTQHRIKLIASF
jgi:hypothetical protein